MHHAGTVTARRLFVAAVVTVVFARSARADFVISELESPLRTEFNDFRGAGFDATGTPGTLDSTTWRVRGFDDGDGLFGGTHLDGDFARGLSGGGVAIGGVYAFEVEPGNTALGFQPGGSDFTPGDLTMRVRNDTASAITSLVLSYAVYVLNDEDRSSSLNFSWSFDDVSWTDVPALDLASGAAADAEGEWTHHGRGTRLSGFELAAGESLFLRWTGDDLGGFGSRDEFALDDVVLTAVPGPGGLLPLVALGVVGPGARRRRRAPR